MDISSLLMEKITGCSIRQNECTVRETKRFFFFFCVYCKNYMHSCFCSKTVKSVLVLEANNTQSYFNLFMNELHNMNFSASCFLPTTAVGAAVTNTTATSLLYTFLVNVSLVFSLKFFMCKCILFSGCDL
jgi:hypothetical protein